MQIFLRKKSFFESFLAILDESPTDLTDRTDFLLLWSKNTHITKKEIACKSKPAGYYSNPSPITYHH